ncbi:MAG: FAD:protein FMN transferase [Bacteroidales bacterium]|nr:FAD:protein FMN transferase [Bacteroidales bacterium]
MRHLLIFIFIILFESCNNKTDYYEIVGNLHTPYHITFQSNSPDKVQQLIQKEMKEYYHSLNPFDSLSIISQVNQNKEIEVDSIFINAFQKSEQISELSDGMLDITCAPLINLWGFGFSKMDSVSPQIIDSLITFVGYKKVRLENKKVIKDDPRILLNFSTVGDGCICDLIADLFDKNGIENYLIEIGGEMSLKGVNKNGDPWRVAITKPVDDNFCRQEEIIYQILHIKERMGVATSGDYRNYYIKDGKKYAHTLNPKTGYPADQNILSATVLSKECITADGLATVIMSIGTRGIEMLKRRIPDLDYFIIYSDSVGSYKTEYSKGMEKYLSQ